MVTRGLAEDTRARLRDEADTRQQELEVEFQHSDWAVEATRYARRQRQLGKEEMAALLGEMGASMPLSREQQEWALSLAARTYLGLKPGDAKLVQVSEGHLRLEVSDCPMNRRLEGSAFGNSACSCFARRRGWYDALGGGLWDQLETNLKWGDPYCSVTIFPNLDAA